MDKDLNSRGEVELYGAVQRFNIPIVYTPMQIHYGMYTHIYDTMISP